MTKRNKKPEVSQCDCCTIVKGGKELNEVLYPFRDYELCKYCVKFWLTMEKKYGERIPFEVIAAGEWENYSIGNKKSVLDMCKKIIARRK